MKIRFINILSVLICFLFALSSLSVYADGNLTKYELTSENMEFILPENTIVLTPDTPIKSSDWLIAGISDPASSYSKYEDLSAVAHFAYVGGIRNIYLSAKSSSAIKAVYNLSDVEKNIQDRILEEYNSINKTEGVTAKSEFLTISDVLFIKSHILSEGENIQMEEICYATIMNGKSYTFSILSQGKLLEEDKEYIDALVSSLKFTLISQPPSNEYSKGELRRMIMYLIAIAAILVSYSIYTIINKRNIEKQKLRYTNEITRFRKERKILEADPNFKDSPPLFLNKTIHSDELLHKLSYFQAYRKNLLAVPGFAFSALVSLYLAISLRSKFFWVLIFGAVSIFCFVRLFFSQGKYDRTLKKMFKKFQNRSAIFTFRENNFKLSGLQTNNIFPYVQITDAYETKDTFYLYFGEDLCYIISKEGFALGSVDDFREFLIRKLKKHFHKR